MHAVHEAGAAPVGTGTSGGAGATSGARQQCALLLPQSETIAGFQSPEGMQEKPLKHAQCARTN